MSHLAEPPALRSARKSPSTTPAPYGAASRALSRARAGWLDDFRAQYEALAPSLYAWARLRSGAGAVDPDDLLQEVWLRAIEAGATFDPERGSFRAWLFGIAKHAYYEALRRRPLRQEPTSASASTALDAWPDVATSIHTRLSRDEAIERLIEHVSAVDELDRKVLIHCGLEDMPCTLAATRLGLGAEAVTKRWQRLRARLRTSGVEALLV